MKNKILAINGESWCRNLTGVERLAIEVTGYIDLIAAPNEIELILPANAKNIPTYKNIKVIQLKKEAKFFPKWTQIHFQNYVLKNHRISLDYSNTCPFLVPGIEFIHDIYGKLFPSDFKTRRDKLIQLYSSIMYKTIAKRAKKIITVSEYTKKTIVDTYHISPERIAVVYSGIGSYKDTQPDFSIFDSFLELKSKPYFVTLGSLSERKNLAWIAKHAELFPSETFVICGKPIPSVVPKDIQKLNDMQNVIMTGYLPDSKVKALLTNSVAFIFPSYFEGFGLPPLEALSCGAKIIISDKTSLPEIYGNCAYYINPDKPETNLTELLKGSVASPEKILDKYTLRKTAERLYSIIKDCIN